MRMLRRLLFLLRHRRADAELREEMELHSELAGRRALGNMALAREDARAVWIAPWIESLCQDVRYAGRTLRRDKAFTLVAVGALGVAIGLNTSVFATANGMLLRRWPVPDAERM